MPFRNQIVAGTALVRDAINSPDYQPGVSGWSINKDGSAEFNDVDIRGGLTVTQDAMSANYSPGVSGWKLGANGTAEFNGNVDMLSGQVTGTLQSTNYVAGTSGWRLNANGTAEFNGNIVTTLVDGKVHSGANADTSISVLNNTATVTNANPQNTPQIIGHAYQALVQVAVNTALAGQRIRYTLWNGTPGTTQLGSMAPIVKAQQTSAGTFETFLMLFVWRAPATATLANINLQMEFLQGTAGNAVTTRVDATFAFIVTDLGLASNITNL